MIRLALLLCLLPSLAAANCWTGQTADRKDVVEGHAKINHEVTWRGISNSGTGMIELFEDEHGEWTLTLTMGDQTTCILGAGYNSTRLLRTPPGEPG